MQNHKNHNQTSFNSSGYQNKVNWSGYDFADFALFNIFNDVLWKDMDLETKHFHLKGRTCQ